MKKIIIWTLCSLVAVIVLGFVSCGSNETKYDMTTKAVSSAKEYAKNLQTAAINDSTGIVLEQIYADTISQIYLFKLIKEDKVSFQYVYPTPNAANVHYLTNILRNRGESLIKKQRLDGANYELKFVRGAIKLYKDKDEVASTHLGSRIKDRPTPKVNEAKDLTPEEMLIVE